MENEGENPRAPETNPSVDQQDTYTTGTGASVFGTSLTYDDPSHAAKICQGLDSMRLLIRYKKKKRYFYQKTWGSSGDNGIIPTETNASPENTCIEGFSPKTESTRKSKSTGYCSSPISFLSYYYFDAQMSFPTLNPPSQGRCVLNPARDAKTRLQTCETPNRASPLIFAYFIPFTAASAKTEPKPLLSAHGGNRKHSYFILQSFCDMDNTQKNINPASFR